MHKIYLCYMDAKQYKQIKSVNISNFNTLLKFMLNYVNYLHISKTHKSANMSHVNMSHVNMSHVNMPVTENAPPPPLMLNSRHPSY